MIECRFLTATIALIATAHSLSAQPSLVLVDSLIDLEVRGHGFPVYRIPALAVTNSGTLVAAYDGRPTQADVPSRISLIVRRSVDGGRSWGERQVVRADTARFGFGDPSLVVDRETGRIFMFHAASVNRGFFDAAPGNRDDDSNVLHTDLSWSDDDGVTWQHRRLTSSIKTPAWRGIFASSGQGIQIRRGQYAGRLVQQFVVRHADSVWGLSVFSDDHGASWERGALVGPGLDENKVVELADGRLMLNSRAKPFRRIAYSYDGGATWSRPHVDSQLVDPANNGAVVRIAPDASPGDARSRWLAFSNTADTSRRMALTVRVSFDDGASWPVAHLLVPGASGYSTLTMLPDGDIGVLFERGNYEAITFARLRLVPDGR